MSHKFRQLAAIATCVSLLGAQAVATIAIVNITGGGDHLIEGEYDGKFVRVDATAGNTVLSISDISALPAGFHIPIIQKIDASSNLVGFRVLKAGDTINQFWDKDAPYPIWLNLTQQGVELVCDGANKCHLLGKTLHRSQPQSQRTIVSSPTLTSFNITPYDGGEVFRVNAAEGAVAGYFDPVLHFTRSGYQSHVIEVMKADASPNEVRIFAHEGEIIDNKPFIVLTKQWEWVSLYIASDGINVRSWYKP